MTKRSMALAVASFAALEAAGQACEAANIGRAWTTALPADRTAEVLAGLTAVLAR
jgi:hypothetical protein